MRTYHMMLFRLQSAPNAADGLMTQSCSCSVSGVGHVSCRCVATRATRALRPLAVLHLALRCNFRNCRDHSPSHPFGFPHPKPVTMLSYGGKWTIAYRTGRERIPYIFWPLALQIRLNRRYPSAWTGRMATAKWIVWPGPLQRCWRRRSPWQRYTKFW